jgi:hypothetical protein
MQRCVLLLALALPLGAQNPVTDAVKASYSRIKQNLIETADVVPESGYSFKLTPAQRTFGEWIEHTAQSAYNFCAGIQGAPPPEAMKALHGMTSKADLSGALKASFAYCDAALSGMNDKTASTEVAIGDRKIFPVTPMVGMIGSLNEHYGNLVGYMRSQGIVPPSSARTANKN